MTASTVEIVGGDLFESGADCLVNATNTVGVMGGGIAAAFKARFPAMFEQYAHDERCGQLETGTVHLWREPEDPHRWIVNLHTKDHWKDPSRYIYVVEGLLDLRQLLEYGSLRNVQKVALPSLGCGLGGLSWDVVCPLVCDLLDDVRPDLTVLLYSPQL